jgi:hypothetical protein
MASQLGPQARAVYAALAEPGTADDVVERTGLIAKSVGPHCSDLAKKGLVECIDLVPNVRGVKVKLWAQVPPERVEEARARAEGRTRRKDPRTFDIGIRKHLVRTLFQDADLLEALDADRAATRAEKRARRAAREELRERERLAKELLRQQRLSDEAEDGRLPFWAAWRKHTQGADAARFLTQLLERDVELAAKRMAPFVEPALWRESERHTADMLRVTGILHRALHKGFNLPATECPVCGLPAPAEMEPEIVDGRVLEELLSLGSGEN